MKVIVTGASGLLGRKNVNKFKNAGWDGKKEFNSLSLER